MSHQPDFPSFSDIPSALWGELFHHALDARLHAHAPYSHFLVGAALLTHDGKILPGCNVENATFAATVCAERTAISSAVAQGHRHFRALCVITQVSPPSAPCGVCRQVIAEFCSELPILIANPQGEFFFATLSELLPFRFSKGDFMPEVS